MLNPTKVNEFLILRFNESRVSLLEKFKETKILAVVEKIVG